MGVAVITGSNGLVGSECVRRFAGLGLDVVGIDNDMRRRFFGPEASTRSQERILQAELPTFRAEDIDIRDEHGVDRVFGDYGQSIELVIHAAAQPSHDWAAKCPVTDFTVNANGTLNLLEATRRRCPEAAFVYVSTNKVYGDRPNSLPLVELDTRWEIEPGHAFEPGIDESMSLDQTKHSLFGVSKASADLMVQEYGRYFGMKTACFRGGCLTGPAHRGAELHGFLAYLMRCVVERRPYTVFGYKGKQVRDNIHSADLAAAFEQFYRAPRVGEVYNIGGGRFSCCSMLEAVDLCERVAGRRLDWTYSSQNRQGDHMWWVSNTAKFEEHYPAWRRQFDLEATVTQIHAALSERLEEVPA